MAQQKMNTGLEKASVIIEAEPESRRAAYRLTARLSLCSVGERAEVDLAKALGYESVKHMLDDVNDQGALIVQIQRGFKEDGLSCKEFDPGITDLAEAFADPYWLTEEQKHWRRFQLIATDRTQMDELNGVLRNGNFTRRELALIVSCLRLRPEFDLDDFKTPSDINECFVQDDP